MPQMCSFWLDFNSSSITSETATTSISRAQNWKIRDKIASCLVKSSRQKNYNAWNFTFYPGSRSHFKYWYCHEFPLMDSRSPYDSRTCIQSQGAPAYPLSAAPVQRSPLPFPSWEWWAPVVCTCEHVVKKSKPLLNNTEQKKKKKRKRKRRFAWVWAVMCFFLHKVAPMITDACGTPKWDIRPLLRGIIASQLQSCGRELLCYTLWNVHHVLVGHDVHVCSAKVSSKGGISDW